MLDTDKIENRRDMTNENRELDISRTDVSRELERLKYLNEKYDLHLHLDYYLPFEEGFKQVGFHEEQNLSIQVYQFKNEKKESVNLSKVFGCPQITRDGELKDAYTCNNGFTNGNNLIIYNHFLQNKEKYKQICQSRNYRLTYTHDTTELIVFDVDDEKDLTQPFIRRLLLKYPYVLSTERQLFKIIIPVIKEYMPPALLNCGFKTKIFEHTDVLGKGNMNYVSYDNHLFNTDFDMLFYTSQDDWKDCPLQEVPKKVKTIPLKTQENTTYPTISKNKMEEMLEFIRVCSTKEFPNEPNKRVGSVYLGEGNTCWLKMCRAIKDWDSTQVGYKILHKFSKLTPNYDEKKWRKGGRSQKDWENCDSMNVNVGYIVNLYQYFRELFPPSSILDPTNPKENFLGKILDQGKDGVNHLDVANFFLQFPTLLYKYRYSLNSKKWYELNEETNLWEKKPSFYLGDFINRFIIPFLMPFLDKFEDEETMKVFKSLLYNIKTVSFQKGVLDHLLKYVSHTCFELELNKNVDVLSFKNGVYNIRENVFRNRLPEDYLSITTNTDYEKLTEEDIIFFRKLFRQIIQPRRMKEDDDEEHIDLEEEVKIDTPYLERETYLYKTLSFPMFGTNTNNAVFLMVGDQGENGKSTINNLCKDAFGEYMIESPNTWLTARSNSIHGTSPIAQYIYNRYLRTSEPDASQKFNTSILKEISGDQDISARALYCENVIFRPQFTLFVECNKLPGIQDPNDGGFRRRAKVIRFNNEFKKESEYKDTIKSYKKQDTKLKDKLKDKKTLNQFIMFLLEMFLKYHRKTYPMKNLDNPPQEYEDYLQNYIKENNPIQAFFEENGYTFLPHNDDKEIQDEYRKKSDEYTVRFLWNVYIDTTKDAMKLETFGKRLALFAGKSIWKYQIKHVLYEKQDLTQDLQTETKIEEEEGILPL